MEGKVANATKGAAFGKRFRDKMTAREIWDSAPKLAVQKSVLQPRLKTRCVEREKGRSGKHVRAPQRKAKVAHGPRRCARVAPRSIWPGKGTDYRDQTTTRRRVGGWVLPRCGTLSPRGRSCGVRQFRLPVSSRPAPRRMPRCVCLRFDAGSPWRGPQCAHPALTRRRLFPAHLPAGSTKKAPGLGGGRAHDTRS
jgi:hypothetical protein